MPAGDPKRDRAMRQVSENLGIIIEESERLTTLIKSSARPATRSLTSRAAPASGLAICREIIEHHGGRLWLESELGRGARFSFTLPVAGA